MNRTQFLLFVSYLFLALLLHSPVWGQSRPRSVSVAEAASIEGTVVDAATNRPIAGVSISAKNQSGKVVAEQRTGAAGAYHLSLDDPKQAYVIVANADGYRSHEEQVAFTTTTSLATQLFKRPIGLYRVGTKPSTAATASPVSSATNPSTLSVLAAPAATPPGPRLTPPKTLDAKVIFAPPLVVAAPGKTTQLRAIQFVQSKAELLPDAQPALEQLAAFLKNNPTTEIELAGHTDNQGDFDENLRLSKQRVEVVKAYLVANGIAANRIATRGYGPTRPIGNNNVETTRQLNRRVEMTVLKQ